MKDIEVVGTFTERKTRPASLDIPYRASKCLDHMLENCDPQHNYLPYVGATLGDDPPHFVHHRLDFTEVLPYSVYGMVAARQMTGSRKGEDVQLAQRKLYLSFFNEGDGLIHAPRSPWSNGYKLCLWEQARALYSFIYWFQDSGEELIWDHMEKLVDGLWRLSYQEGHKRAFPRRLIEDVGMGPYGVGSLIDPLTKYYEMSGNQKAFLMARGLTAFMLDPDAGFFDAEGASRGNYRTVTSVVNGLSRFASLTAEPKLLEKARLIHDKAVSICTWYGSTPCVEPACSDMELNMSALALARAGLTEYWDQIDRFTRNQTAESQFLDPTEWVQEKALKGRRMDKALWVTDFWPDDLHILPYDDYRDVVDRSVGGFIWTSADEHLFIPASVMLCCCAHAMRSFQIVWENAIRETIDSVTVNLHFNVENEIGEVISYEPFEGKTSVILKRGARNLRIRVPEHAIGCEVTATCDDEPVEVRMQGRYASLGAVQPDREYTLLYPLNPSTTDETQYAFDDKGEPIAKEKRFEARWRGNTVIELLPESEEEKRIYKRAHLDTDEVSYHDVSYFISSRKLDW